MYLEYHGLTVKEAGDGEDALSVLDRESFDVVLSDIMMPKMDGLTLAEGGAEAAAEHNDHPHDRLCLPSIRRWMR